MFLLCGRCVGALWLSAPAHSKPQGSNWYIKIDISTNFEQIEANSAGTHVAKEKASQCEASNRSDVMWEPGKSKDFCAFELA